MQQSAARLDVFEARVPLLLVVVLFAVRLLCQLPC
jgi:hypothetical protein